MGIDEPVQMNRDHMLVKAGDPQQVWDLLIVGGGATGLGAALDAASRGYQTLLIEQADFTQATSSRSTKLIHGGVRYLQQLQLKMVRESLRERRYLLQNAPHLVHPLRFVIPCRNLGEQAYYYAGMKAYDWLAGKQAVAPARWLGRKESLDRLATLRPDRLRGGIEYSDAQFDDAGLGMGLARTAARYGCTLLNYAQLQGLDTRQPIKAAEFVDIETGRSYRIRAKVVVNATGIFVENIMRLTNGASGATTENRPSVMPSRGTHIVLDRSFLPGDSAVLLPKTKDGRVLFLIPWLGSTLVGTTDIETKQVELSPTATVEEVDYLLEHAGEVLVRQPIRNDVRSVFAGLRPLVRPSTGSSSQASREHVIDVQNGVISVLGGKWTTYRKMAEDVVDIASRIGHLPSRPSLTSNVPIDQSCTRGVGASLVVDEKLVRTATQFEMARTVEDILARRSRLLFCDSTAAIRAAPDVAGWMAKSLGHDESWQREQLAGFREAAKKYTLP